VALKADGPTLVHKTDRAAVALHVNSRAEVRRTFRRLRSQLGDAMQRAVIQPMAPSGVETVVGVVHDPSFGPLVMFGMGGIATDLLGDRSFRILPLTDVDAHELVGSLRSSPLLFGYRGAPPVDLGALEQLLVRVACLADDIPELAELDLNPVIAAPNGTYAVDVKIRVAPCARPAGTGLRRLRNPAGEGTEEPISMTTDRPTSASDFTTGGTMTGETIDVVANVLHHIAPEVNIQDIDPDGLLPERLDLDGLPQLCSRPARANRSGDSRRDDPEMARLSGCRASCDLINHSDELMPTFAWTSAEA
jgi:hypothetical protein